MSRQSPSPKPSPVQSTGKGSVWQAAPNARFAALETLKLRPPTPDEASAFREAALEETRLRAKAYRTPVTEETLRRSIR